MALLRWLMLPRLRFSLRGMLLALTAGCLLLGWQVEERRRLMFAVERVQAARWQVGSLHTDAYFAYTYCVSYDPTQLVTRFWDAQMLPNRAVAHYVSDEQAFAAVTQLTTIETLYFTTLEPCDEWLRHLESLQRLKTLSVAFPTLTDRAIPHLCQLKGLECLAADCRGMTAEGLLQLRRALPNCEFTISFKDDVTWEHYLPLNGRTVKPRVTY
jgi:hypothetical protein